MQIVLWRGGFSSSRHISRIRWLDSLILLPLVFLRKLHLLYMIAVLLTFFEIAYDSSLSYDLKVYLSSFYKAISTHVKIYLIVILIYISQWLVMLNIKIYTVVICMSFEKCLFKSSDQFFWVSVYVCVFVCIYTCVCVCVHMFGQVYSPMDEYLEGRGQYQVLSSFELSIFLFFLFFFVLTSHLTSTWSSPFRIDCQLAPGSRLLLPAAHPSTGAVNVYSSCFCFFKQGY